jgi:putative cardiolipin synthase
LLGCDGGLAGAARRDGARDDSCFDGERGMRLAGAAAGSEKGARCYHPRPVKAPLRLGQRQHDRLPIQTLVSWLAGLWLVAALSGCMSLPDVTDRHWDGALLPARSAELGRIAEASVIPGELSGFRLLTTGSEALQARLELIDRAQVSIDLQAYQFKADASGLMLVRALRDAAGRGVRVRLLLDDLYTAGDDALWLGLAAHSGVEIRLFNPFLAGRDSHLSRLTESALGDKRMHRRMHNKLLVADGVLALAGGRNIADAYFLTQAPERFVDIDVLVAGSVVPSMALAFDLYWNSDFSHELRSVVEEPLPMAARRVRFVQLLPPAQPPGATQRLNDSAIAREFAQGCVSMHQALAQVAYDSPDKLENEQVAVDLGMLATAGAQVRLTVAQVLRQAKYEVWVVTPYLIPGATGVAALREFNRRGVRVVLLTNSLAATDEPAVHLGYRKYRGDVLAAGAELYEWSPAHGDRVLREMLVGGTVFRLHAKAAIVDREVVFLGSMNFDPRSRDLNTEFGLLIRSPELAEEIRAVTERWAHEGSFRVRLDADGKTLRWYSAGDDRPLQEVEPDTDLGSRLLLDLLEPWVPEEML